MSALALRVSSAYRVWPLWHDCIGLCLLLGSIAIALHGWIQSTILEGKFERYQVVYLLFLLMYVQKFFKFGKGSLPPLDPPQTPTNHLDYFFFGATSSKGGHLPIISERKKTKSKGNTKIPTLYQFVPKRKVIERADIITALFWKFETIWYDLSG